MAKFILDFEKPIIELEQKIEEMSTLAMNQNLDLREEIQKLREKLARRIKKTYSGLTPWQRVQLARHPDRPHTLDYIERMTDSYIEIHGDRNFRDDPAIVCTLSRIKGLSLVILGHQKGRNTKDNLFRNFGMPHPEGYRKALRAMKLAAKFGIPVVSLIDTPGAFPGIGAEERGQAEAIARNLFEMSRLPVPILIIIIGEGASGGALGIGVGDRVLMMENTWYSVISPEGCASILYKDASKAPVAAEAMKLTAPELLKMGVIDEIIKEPEGGAHRNWDAAANVLKEKIISNLQTLSRLPEKELLEQRIQKLEQMGEWIEE